AQPERFELGQRLRAFEAAWDAHPEADARHRALPPLKRATNYFFAGLAAEAGKALDQAAFALHSPAAPPAGVAWATSLYAVPDTRLLDAAAVELAVTVRAYYDPTAVIPAGA